MAKIKPVVEKCKGCVKILPDGTCCAFTDPSYMWKDKECFGRAESVDDLYEIINDIVRASPNHPNIARKTGVVNSLNECIKYHQSASRLSSPASLIKG